MLRLMGDRKRGRVQQAGKSLLSSPEHLFWDIVLHTDCADTSHTAEVGRPDCFDRQSHATLCTMFYLIAGSLSSSLTFVHFSHTWSMAVFWIPSDNKVHENVFWVINRYAKREGMFITVIFVVFGNIWRDIASKSFHKIIKIASIYISLVILSLRRILKCFRGWRTWELQPVHSKSSQCTRSLRDAHLRRGIPGWNVETWKRWRYYERQIGWKRTQELPNPTLRWNNCLPLYRLSYLSRCHARKIMHG